MTKFYNFFSATRFVCALVLGLCLFLTSGVFAQTNTYSGTGNWDNAANWSLGTVPSASDLVVIPKTSTVTVTATPASACLKITVHGDDAGQGVLIINPGVTLTVTSGTGSSVSCILLQGGLLENNGTLVLTGSTTVEGIRFGNPLNSATMVSDTYKGSGVLNINTTATTPTSTGTGACAYFTQANGTATFELGAGSASSTFVAPNLGSIFFIAAAGLNISGTGTINTNGNFRTMRLISNVSSEATNVTIGANVTFNVISSLLTTFTAAFLVDRSGAASAPVKLTNNGTLNISGTSSNGIYVVNSTSSTVPNTSTFENNGTIKINGLFNDATANVTFGGIVMAGANTNGAFFNNYGTIDYNTTASGLSAKPLFYSGTAPIYTITNYGTGNIHVGSNGTNTQAVLLGNSGATFDNFGTLTIDKGNISGGGLTANFNNKSTGVLNMNLEVDNVAPKSAFTNNINFINDGKFKGTGAIFAATTTATFNASSTFEPSQPTSNTGRIVYYTTGTCSLAGTTFNANVNGKAAPGFDFDQIGITSGTVDVTGMKIIVTQGVGYTPTNGDVIGLVISANPVIGTPIYTLPTGWTGGFSGNNVVITYSGTIPVELVSFKATPLSKSNKLTWQTASEINNKGFDIQRQTQTGDWESLGFVNAQGKAANYTFEDKAPLPISYYRLHQMDFDGKETFSKVVSVFMGKGGKLNAFPTLAKDNLTISVENTGIQTYNIYDLMGKTVQTGQFDGQKTLTVNALPIGTYILKVGSETVKFLKN